MAQRNAVLTTKSERWKRAHVQQLQYMLQIFKCNDQSCCKSLANYLTYFPERFLQPPVPLKSTNDGLEIFEGIIESLFQAIFLEKYEKCYDKFFPSLQKVAEGEQKR